MPKRNAAGTGTIRQRPDGRWECRVTVGRDPGTGKQMRKSFYAASQKELVALMKDVQADLQNGAFVEPSKMTVGQWVDIWAAEYLGNVSQGTKAGYEGTIKKHITPNLGAVNLQKLHAHDIQKFYNELERGGKSAKTVRNIHGVFHSALDQAMKLGYIKQNPSSLCTLPRPVKKEMKVMTDDTLGEFLDAIKGERYETVYYIDVFTGMRQGEILGLTWDCVDFKAGTILIDKQLIQEKKKLGAYYLGLPKHDKVRKIKPAGMVMDKLRARKAKQAADQLQAGAAWDNPWNLVFTNEIGRYLSHKMVRKPYKRIVAAMGISDLRFHDMRHSYAVLSLTNGDDVKTLQSNLGHHSAGFTLDQYGHVTERMQEESAQRMDNYINSLNAQSKA
jgi:integrase